MKKYKLIIIFLTILYLILAGSNYVVMNHINDKSNNEYRVQISRLSNHLNTNGIFNSVKQNEILTIDKKDYGDPDNLSRITYITADTNHSEIINQFYEPKNGYAFEVVPITQNNNIMGYLRFDYQKNLSNQSFITLSELLLMVIYVLSISVLLYMDQKILKPFHQFSNMPFELSKGNLKGNVKESKSRYFGRFLWGIEMLRDTLENHKNKELKLAREKKMLLLSISHDIMTPLNAINLYAKSLQEGIYEVEEEKQNALLKIQEKTSEINNFVKEIIKSSTEDVISIEVNQSEYYLEDFLEKVREGYSEKCKLNKMEFKIEPFDNYLIKGDMDRMYEAIGNLIENAFKYGDGKNLHITFSEEDYCVLIQVYNSGIPIQDSEMPHLFDSFYRGSNTEGKAGNGLGLYICKEIMRKMHGEIFARQAKDGMEFILVCPIS